MPRKCCADVCKTKYDSKKDEENCHVFGFPTDKTPGCAARRKAWVSERVTIIDQFLPFTARFKSEYAVFCISKLKTWLNSYKNLLIWLEIT